MERDTLVQVAVSTGAVGLFTVLIVGIGAAYNDGGLSETGALAVVGSIVLFVLVMAGVGYWLAGRH